RLERLARDHLVGCKAVHASHARQPWLAVDLHRAASALAGLAVPAQREVVGVTGLDPVQHVQHNHPRIDLYVVRLEVTAGRVATPDLELALAHSTPAPTVPDSRSSILA